MLFRLVGWFLPFAPSFFHFASYLPSSVFILPLSFSSFQFFLSFLLSYITLIFFRHFPRLFSFLLMIPFLIIILYHVYSFTFIRLHIFSLICLFIFLSVMLYFMPSFFLISYSWHFFHRMGHIALIMYDALGRIRREVSLACFRHYLRIFYKELQKQRVSSVRQGGLQGDTLRYCQVWKWVLTSTFKFENIWKRVSIL
jgi:hypothetical protein